MFYCDKTSCRETAAASGDAGALRSVQIKMVQGLKQIIPVGSQKTIMFSDSRNDVSTALKRKWYNDT